MAKGFIRIPKSLFDSNIWNQRHVYSESDAFLDIYKLANDNDNQLETSTREFALRWRWETTRVFRFLKRMKDEGFISVKKLKSGTVIQVVNFGEKISKCNTSATPNATPNATPKSLFTKDFSKVDATPNATPNATQVQHLSCAYKNDNIISCLKLKTKTPPLYSPQGEHDFSIFGDFDFSFISDEYRKAFFTWLEYKKGRREKYKTQKSLEACYKKLIRDCNNSPEIAIQMVEQSMANNYMGLFPLKSQPKNKDEKNDTILHDNSQEKYKKMEIW